MKTFLAFAAGFLTGLAIYQTPRMIAPLFQDEPETPEGHTLKFAYSNDGELIYSSDPADYFNGWHSGRPTYEESAA